MTSYLNADVTPVEMLPGLVRRTLAEGDSMMVCEFTFESGGQVPNHSHPHEQVGYVVSGRMRMFIDGVAYEVGPGDSYLMRSEVPHGGLSLEPTVLIETFSPPREDYLERVKIKTL